MPLQLDVKVFIAALAVGCKEIVAIGAKLEEFSIKSPEMIVSPCAAELVIVGAAHFCNRVANEVTYGNS